MTCNCGSARFLYAPTGHVITDNVDIVKNTESGFHTEGGVPWDIPPQGPVFPPPKNFISQCHNESN